VFIIYFSCVWVAGIWLGYYLDLPPALSLVGLIPLLTLFFTRTHRKLLIITGLGIIIFVIGAVYAYASSYEINEGKVHFYNDRGVTGLKGTVSGDPDVRDTSARLTLSAAEIKLDTGWRQVAGKVLVVVPRYPAYSYGDYLHLTGKLETPPPVGDFDYRGYLAHQGIYATMYYPGVEVLDKGRGSPILAGIYNLRSRLSDVLAEVLPEPQAALAQGIVLGIRSNIPAELKHDFAVSGTTHLLAISGLNIGIMAGVLLGIGLSLFGRRHYLYVWLTFGAVWLYTIITGMNPPVLRGAIMASLFLLAEALGRQRSAMVALAFAAAVMVGISPYVLGDASFQMSFLAMAGLVFIYPILQGLGRKLVSSKLGEEGVLASLANVTVDTWSATLAATIAIWPVLAYSFGFVSLVGPMATFLAMPVLPLIIVTGALAGVIGLVAVIAAQAVGWLAWIFLSYMIIVVSGLAAPSLASVEVGRIHPAVVAGYYLLLAFIIWLNSRRKKSKSPFSGAAARMKAGLNISFGLSRKMNGLIVPLLLLAVLVSYTAATLPDDDLRVSFLDVGEGDAVLIQQGSKQVLVDGGPSPQAITLALSREMPFWDRTIDLLVLTHPHQDHLAGLVDVMRRYKVERVLYPAIDYASPMYDGLFRLITEKGVKSTAARAGQRLDLGAGAWLEVLNPPEALLSGTESDIDNNSVVLRLSDGAVSFILTGDIMREAEWDLIRGRAAIASTVIKVAHHGSDTSTSPEFLAVAGPRAAVVSCGAGNKFGHPFAAVLNRLEGKVGAGNIFRTDKQGTIDFTTDGKRLWVKEENGVK
jgi:competence protein ComEC